MRIILTTITTRIKWIINNNTNSKNKSANRSDFSRRAWARRTRMGRRFRGQTSTIRQISMNQMIRWNPSTTHQKWNRSTNPTPIPKWWTVPSRRLGAHKRCTGRVLRNLRQKHQYKYRKSKWAARQDSLANTQYAPQTRTSWPIPACCLRRTTKPSTAWAVNGCRGCRSRMAKTTTTKILLVNYKRKIGSKSHRSSKKAQVAQTSRRYTRQSLLTTSTNQ